MFGSDQAASIEPQELKTLVADVRAVEAAIGDGTKRVLEAEMPIRAKLRRK
jgi:N-acetylneuraminate synthase